MNGYCVLRIVHVTLFYVESLNNTKTRSEKYSFPFFLDWIDSKRSLLSDQEKGITKLINSVYSIYVIVKKFGGPSLLIPLY